MRATVPLLFVAAGCVLPARPLYCSTNHREVAVDEPVGSGFSAAEVLPFLVGGHVEVAWADGEEQEEVTAHLAPLQRILACEGHDAGGNDPVVDRLDLEVEVELTTADGRFTGETTRVFASTTDGLWVRIEYAIQAPEPAEVVLDLADGQFGGVVHDDELGDILLAWPYDDWAGRASLQ